jgi:hypothetical protein
MLKKSSPLKLLGQMEPNLAGSIYVRSSIKLRSWHAEHVCCLNLTSISYSFWNKKRKVLKFRKFDEKRAITPR